MSNLNHKDTKPLGTKKTIYSPDEELAIAPQLGRVLFSILFAAYSIGVPLLANALGRIIPTGERYRKAVLVAGIVLLLSLLGLVAMFISIFGI